MNDRIEVCAQTINRMETLLLKVFFTLHCLVSKAFLCKHRSSHGRLLEIQLKTILIQIVIITVSNKEQHVDFQKPTNFTFGTQMVGHEHPSDPAIAATFQSLMSCKKFFKKYILLFLACSVPSITFQNKESSLQRSR